VGTSVAIVLLIVSALASLVGGAIILSNNRDSKSNLAFFGFSLGIASWSIGIAGFMGTQYFPLALIWAKFYYFAPILLVFSSVFFAELFIIDSKLRKSIRVLLNLATAALVIPLVTMPHFLTGSIVNRPYGKQVLLDKSHYTLYAIYLIISFALTVIIMLLKLRKVSQKNQRQQIYTFIIGYIVSCILGVYFNLFLPWVGNYSLIAIGPISTTFFLITTAYSIVKHHMFDIRVFVIRAAAYTTTITLLVIGYVVPLIFLFLVIFKLPFKPVQFAMATIVATLAATYYHKLQGWFNRVTSRIFFRDAYDPTELIGELNKSLITTIILKDILHLTASLVEKYIKTDLCTFILPSSDHSTIRQIGGRKWSVEGFDFAHLELAMKKERKGIITLASVEKADNSTLRDMLRASEISIVVRLVSGGKDSNDTIGYMLIGPRKSGKAYDYQDLQVFEAIANTLVIAMQNALHYEEIQQFNETLQERIEEATHKLKSTNEKLKKMDETKDEFISMASHQLRTPLTSVKGYVSMVLDGDVGPINPQQRELLGQSFASSQRMANLISDLLNLSRINTGKFVIEESQVYLPQIIEAELGQLREMAEGKNIELKLDLPVAFPKLMLDDNKMHQVVMNLIDNALYYTPDGGKVTVSLIDTPETVEFRVIDNGIGVPRESQRHLFSKMYRADNARRARPDGTGLGLFMVKKVIVEQQGAVIFESEENKGSTFGFRFNKKDHLVPVEGAEESPVEQVTPLAAS